MEENKGKELIRLYLEASEKERNVLEGLDWLASHAKVRKTRKELWRIRSEVLELLMSEYVLHDLKIS